MEFEYCVLVLRVLQVTFIKSNISMPGNPKCAASLPRTTINLYVVTQSLDFFALDTTNT